MSTKLVTDLPMPSPEPAVVRAEIRGGIYTFTELSMDRYNALVEKASHKEKNDITGEMEDVTDNTLLMRLMIMDSTTPKPTELLARGVRYYRSLAKIVNDLHFGDEKVKLLDEDDVPEGPKEGV